MKINFTEGMKYSKQQDIELMEKYPFVYYYLLIGGIVLLVAFGMAGYALAGLK